MGITECVRRCIGDAVNEARQQAPCNEYAENGLKNIVNGYVDTINSSRDALSSFNNRETVAQTEYKRAFESLIAFQEKLPNTEACRNAFVPDVARRGSADLYNKRVEALEKEDLPNEDIISIIMTSFEARLGANKLANSIGGYPNSEPPFILAVTTVPTLVVGWAEASGAVASIGAGALGAATGLLLAGGLIAPAEAIVYTYKVNSDIRRID